MSAHVPWWCLLSFLISASQISGAKKQLMRANCQTESPFITIGDYFALEDKDRTENVFTVSLTQNATCKRMPVVVLRGRAQYLTETLVPLILLPFDSKKVRLRIKGVLYHKKTLFYSIDRMHIAEGYYTWEIRTDNGHGPIEHTVERIPDLALKNVPTKLFMIADLDEDPVADPTWKQLDLASPEQFDMIVHVGDFAYDIHHDHGQRGDKYFAKASLSGRRIPYVVIAGNHENFAEGKLFNYRFRLPTADESNSRYDFVYKDNYYMFINLDWILRYSPRKNKEHVSRELEMLRWMQGRERILQNRTDIKWKIFFTHRPFECSDPYCRDCFVNGLIFRRIADQAAKMGFHLMMTAHTHIYARQKLFHGLQEFPMARVGNGVMLTVINGHAGCGFFFENETQRPLFWSALDDRLDVSGPTYLKLDITDEVINGNLIRTDIGSITDQFQLDKKIINGGLLINFYTWLAVLFGTTIVVVMSYVLRSISKNHKPSADETKYYHQPSEVELGSDS